MGKKIIKMSLGDLKKMLFPDDNTEVTEQEDVVETTYNVELTEPELDMLTKLTDMIEGDDDGEQAILDSVIGKFENCKNTEKDVN